MLNDKWLCVMGIGDDGASGLRPDYLARIHAADVLLGSERQLAFFSDFLGEKVVFPAPIAGVVELLYARYNAARVVVLASGDPMFYSIGAYLVKKMGAQAVEVYPHISSVQLAFARAGESWQDALVVSVHGRGIAGLAQKIANKEKVALLTGDDNTPSAIASYLLKFQMTEYDAFVGEHLGGAKERTGWYELSELVERQFSDLNVVVLRKKSGAQVRRWSLGIGDAEFYQRTPDRGLITKREIRVLSLAELRLQPDSVLWDIGACTGSVSIEAVLHTPGLRAFAIEKNADDFRNLVENQIKFRTDFVAVHGRAPARLEEFDDPDSVFIGGSGGELEELLQICAQRLRPGGRIVVNAVTIETLSLAQQTLKRLGFAVNIHLLQTARSKPILNLTRFEGMNPVYLISAWRGENNE